MQNGKMTLTEVAPGIAIEKDIISLMGFRPHISETLKEMVKDIFRNEWGK
ncbi:hypothetical protein V7147_09725 [Bacillus sp. JJ1521]